ncbi:hypothetical protein EUX98_g8001 [Antrodiella citrinella]|uniref:Uncharacterized protein n=1 Tax=Antrodiella citrinella TaxID=2447956 RepID=A0A4S4ME67_9APHY|nr:hypothetical protein EUX98_g8001 [Antrodiella citrinella]
MGYGWRLFNIDMRYFCDVGKLEEGFPHGGLHYLNDLLARPTGVQRDLHYKPAQGFREVRHFEELEYLIWEAEEDHGLTVKRTKPQQRHRSSTLKPRSGPSGRLGALPVEMICMIFDELDDVLSVVCLSLASVFLFEVGYDALVSRWFSKAASTWAGCRLICVGEDSDAKDIPKDVFTPAEQVQLEEAALMADDEDDEDTEDSLDHALAYMQPRPSDYQRHKHESIFTADFWMKTRKMNLFARPLAEQKCLLELLEIEDVTKLKFDDERPDWALCNLVTGEYVRADAIASLTAGLDLKNVRKGHNVGRVAGFAEVVVARIFWSPSRYDPDADGQFDRGVWAGHRFEITVRDRFRALGDGRAWKDISEEVMKEMQDLWKLFFREEWQKNL